MAHSFMDTIICKNILYYWQMEHFCSNFTYRTGGEIYINQKPLDNVLSKIEQFSKTDKRIILKGRFIRFNRFDRKVLINFAKTNCASIKVSYTNNSIRVEYKLAYPVQ